MDNLPPSSSPHSSAPLEQVARESSFAPPPPIPSPIPPVTSAPISVDAETGFPKASYAIPVAIGLGVFVVLLASRIAIGLMPVAGAVLTFYIVTSVVGTYLTWAAGKKLNYEVKGASDLLTVRRAVNLNMRMAYAIMVTIYPFLLISLIGGSFVVSAILIFYSLVFGAVATAVEKKFKAMPVVNENPVSNAELRAEFDRMLVLWKEPRFGLPEAVN